MGSAADRIPELSERESVSRKIEPDTYSVRERGRADLYCVSVPRSASQNIKTYSRSGSRPIDFNADLRSTGTEGVNKQSSMSLSRSSEVDLLHYRSSRLRIVMNERYDS